MILIPTVMGVSDLEIGFGRQLVELGYNAFVADLFGKEFRGAPRDTMFGEMNRLQSRPRGAAPPAASSPRRWSAGSTRWRTEQIVVAGYCFGGHVRARCRAERRRHRRGVSASTACSIRRASRRRRSRRRSSPSTAGTIRWSRPRRSSRSGQELTEAGSDWQIHAYGHVGHGFTNPHASELQIDGVAYNALAAERSWTSFINLLEELFAAHG